MGFTTKIETEVSHSYDGIVEQLDGTGSKTFAAVILEALENKGDCLIDWKGMSPLQVEAAMELIVLTHVAEGAVPLQKEVNVQSANAFYRKVIITIVSRDRSRIFSIKKCTLETLSL